MQFIRKLGAVLVKVICSLGRMILLLLWMGLLGLLYLEMRLVTLDKIELPAYAKDQLQKQFTELGLQLDYSQAQFDPSGHILLENVSLGDPTISGPLITVRRLTTQVNPWKILAGTFDVFWDAAISHLHTVNPQKILADSFDRQEVQITGAKLFQVVKPRPDATAPAGSNAPAHATVEMVADDINCTLQLTPTDLVVPQLTAEVGVVQVSAHGALRLPQSKGPFDPHALLNAYEAMAAQLASLGDGAHFQDPQVDIVLTPADRTIAVADVVVTAAGWPDKKFTPDNNIASQLECGPLRLTTTVPLQAPDADPVEITGEVQHPAWPKAGYSADGVVHFNLTGDWRRPPSAKGSSSGPNFTSLQLKATLDSVTSRDWQVSTGAVALTVRLDQGEDSADVGVQLAGQPWSVKARYKSATGVTALAFAGPLNPELLELADKVAKINLADILHLDAPARVAGTAEVSAAGAWSHLQGWVENGPIKIAGVAIDGGGAHVTLANGRLMCDEVDVQIGESGAHGNYEMDLANLDFRFLLKGQLRAPAIAGWFGGWWPAIWRNFSFGPAPTADIDVQGRWGAPERTTVYLSADAPESAIHGVAFDQIHTRMFLRPGWDDVLDFSVQQGSQQAQGAFTMQEDAEGKYLRYLIFNLTSDLEPAALATLAGPSRAEWFTPYQFAHAPRLTLAGRLDGETAAGWTHTTLDLGVASTGEVDLGGFPVSDLVTQVQVRDDAVELPSFTLGFAGGQTAGRMRVWPAPAGGRQLAFEAKLTGANFGSAISALENYNVTGPPKLVPAASKFQLKLATGKLDLTLAAQGAWEFPPRLHGQGHADLTAADLGQIQLFGLLSTLLSHTLLNFSSMSLDTVRADFLLDGEKVSFPQTSPTQTKPGLTLTGPRGVIQADGDYHLDTSQLNFTAEILPFEAGHGLVDDVAKVFTKLFSSALKVKLQGTLTQPNWVFVLGPTSLLREITGANSRAPVPPAQK